MGVIFLFILKTKQKFESEGRARKKFPTKHLYVMAGNPPLVRSAAQTRQTQPRVGALVTTSHKKRVEWSIGGFAPNQTTHEVPRINAIHINTYLFYRLYLYLYTVHTLRELETDKICLELKVLKIFVFILTLKVDYKKKIRCIMPALCALCNSRSASVSSFKVVFTRCVLVVSIYYVFVTYSFISS